MLTIIKTNRDLFLDDCDNRNSVIATLADYVPYYYTDKQVAELAEIFIQNSNLILFTSETHLNISKLFRNDSVPAHTFMCFDGATVQYLRNGVLTHLNRKIDYVISDINYVNFNNSYSFIGYELSDLNLYGSAQTYFRNKIIDSVLKSL